MTDILVGIYNATKEEQLAHFHYVISRNTPLYSRKKGTCYQLTDEYSLFYLKFIGIIECNKNVDLNKLAQTQSWKSWSDYAFENIV